MHLKFWTKIKRRMRISFLLLPLFSLGGCKDTDKTNEPKETRGALMERIEKEKEKETAG